MKEIEKLLRQERYLEGIRRFQQKGIRILFNGEEMPEESWNDLFLREENGFYRSDHVRSSEGKLSEIRFEWVCHAAQNGTGG